MTTIVISITAIRILVIIVTIMAHIIRMLDQTEYARDHAEVSDRDGNYGSNCHYSGNHR